MHHARTHRARGAHGIVLARSRHLPSEPLSLAWHACYRARQRQRISAQRRNARAPKQAGQRCCSYFLPPLPFFLPLPPLLPAWPPAPALGPLAPAAAADDVGTGAGVESCLPCVRIASSETSSSSCPMAAVCVDATCGLVWSLSPASPAPILLEDWGCAMQEFAAELGGGQVAVVVMGTTCTSPVSETVPPDVSTGEKAPLFNAAPDVGVAGLSGERPSSSGACPSALSSLLSKVTSAVGAPAMGALGAELPPVAGGWSAACGSVARGLGVPSSFSRGMLRSTPSDARSPQHAAKQQGGKQQDDE